MLSFFSIEGGRGKRQSQEKSPEARYVDYRPYIFAPHSAPPSSPFLSVSFKRLDKLCSDVKSLK